MLAKNYCNMAKNKRRKKYEKERIEEVSQYYEDTFAATKEAEIVHIRARLCDNAMFLTWVLTLIWLGLGDEEFYSRYEWIKEIAFTLYLLTAVRAWFHFTIYREIHGVHEGCKETLRCLGYLERDNDRGDKTKRKVKRKSLFERYKEFWERVGTKDKQEAYA